MFSRTFKTLNKKADGAHLEVILVIHKQVNLRARRSNLKILNTGLEIAGCQWPKAGHILEMAGENKTGLPN